MEALAVLISATLANLITQWLKPRRDTRLAVQELLDARKSLIRGLNAFSGVVLLILTAWLLGDPLQAGDIQEGINSSLTAFITYAVSQGGYYLTHKQ